MRKRDGFLAKHGIIPADGFAGYHYAYALYALYMIDAMRLAEELSKLLPYSSILHRDKRVNIQSKRQKCPFMLKCVIVTL